MISSISTRKRAAISIIAAIIIVLAALGYVHHRSLHERRYGMPVVSTNAIPHLVRYGDYFFGVSFSYMSDWKFGRNANVMTFNDTASDTITIVEIKGSTVTTSSDTYGTVTYAYHDGALMTSGVSTSTASATSTPIMATPLFTLANGWAVVPGSSSAKTDIVCIPDKGFVIIDSGKSGNTGSVDQIAHSFAATSGTNPYSDIP
jgi:hypothetical protein